MDLCKIPNNTYKSVLTFDYASSILATFYARTHELLYQSSQKLFVKDYHLYFSVYFHEEYFI